MPAILLERPLGAILWEATRLWEAATRATMTFPRYGIVAGKARSHKY